MSNYHTPVLVQEAIGGLLVRPGGMYIDATVGGGGHGIEIVRRGGLLLGIDTDPEAIEFARRNIKSQISNIKNFGEGKAWKLVQGNFRDIEKIAGENGFDRILGVLFDLGVSTHQLDTPGRGFSYRYPESPLDLRLDQHAPAEPAAELICNLSEHELYEIFATLGEERLAGTIARAVVRARRVGPIQTVGQLVGIIDQVLPNQRDEAGILSRIFQALRIAVNDELGALKKGLVGAAEVLEENGRLVVISFHSLEDRIVKQFMKQKGWVMLNKKPIEASREEQALNPRCRSAKLRIAVKDSTTV